MSYVDDLACRECGKSYPREPLFVCDECFGPLELSYRFAHIREEVERTSVGSGPRNLWRYRALLPVEGEPVAGDDVGFTPLVKAHRLGEVLGLRKLYIKND